ncbi:MAG: hypothetical protein DRH04_01700 [Deltaproteobacteria bacterium]|nr:MAG: hypothetical protein DRH04_01700 [Deltaproteobacteria bacterium]
MKYFSVIFMLAVSTMVSFAVLPGNSQATVEVRAERTVPLAGVSKAITLSPDGRMVFVLTEDGQVHIYESTGGLRGMVKVGADSTDIAVSPDGSRLYVTEGSRKTLKVLELDYVVQLKTSHAPFKGPEDAPVVIVVFGDFQCPYCAKLNPLLRQVLEKYPHQVKLIYKFLPLTSIHKFSMQSAIAALAAARQGKFWLYHDGLLAVYRELSEKKLLEIGEQCGLDMEQFDRDRKDPRLVNLVREDIGEAGDNNIRSVPSVFINGRQLRSRSLKSFDQAISAELHRLGLGN